MSTKKVATNQYAPSGMAAYDQMTPQASSNMMDFMQNPLQSMFFNTQVGMANKQIGQQGQTQMQTLLNNIRQTMGGGASSPFMMSQMAQQGRSQGSQQAGAFNNLLLGANQLRMGATQGALGYQPLQTGSTQTTSGLGTWLPQLLGAGLGAISGGLFGGGGGGGGSFAGGTPMTAGNMAMPSPFTMGQQSPFAGQPMAPPSIQGGMPGGGLLGAQW